MRFEGRGFRRCRFHRLCLRKGVEQEGIRPLVVDLLTYARRLENLKDTDHEFVKADIREQSIHEILKQPDLVVNFATETHLDRSIYKP